MIIDKINNYNNHNFENNNIRRAFQYLDKIDINNLQVGKYEIDGEKIFFIVTRYNTIDEDKALWEVHEKYIDIHYIIEGTEKIGYTTLDKFDVVEKYKNDLDVALGNAKGDFYLLGKGEFMILNTQEVHKPAITINNEVEVTKIILKVYNY